MIARSYSTNDNYTEELERRRQRLREILSDNNNYTEELARRQRLRQLYFNNSSITIVNSIGFQNTEGDIITDLANNLSNGERRYNSAIQNSILANSLSNGDRLYNAAIQNSITIPNTQRDPIIDLVNNLSNDERHYSDHLDRLNRSIGYSYPDYSSLFLTNDEHLNADLIEKLKGASHFSNILQDDEEMCAAF